MDETNALVRLEPIKPLNAAALPRYFSEALAKRERLRANAQGEAIGEGMAAGFFSFLTVVLGYLSTLLWIPSAPLIMLAILSAVGAGGALVITIKAGWTCLERFSFLRGTRDETKYLPADCRTCASAEASLSIAFDEVDAAAARWNAALPLLEEHGTPKLRRIADANRESIEARRRAIATETGRLWTLAAQSTDPSALPARVAVRELAPCSDWGVMEEIDLAKPADS